MPRRVFFGLWPGDGLRQQLAALQSSPALPKGQRVPAGNLHITLHFVGNTSAVDCLLEQAQQICGQRFNVQIDRFGWFKRAGVAWAGCSEVPEAMVQLAASCATTSRHCAALGDASAAYTPHVTLRRKVTHPPQAAGFTPIIWRVRSFHLLESRPLPAGGVHYVSIGEFPLACSVLFATGGTVGMGT